MRPYVRRRRGVDLTARARTPSRGYYFLLLLLLVSSRLVSSRFTSRTLNKYQSEKTRTFRDRDAAGTVGLRTGHTRVRTFSKRRKKTQDTCVPFQAKSSYSRVNFRNDVRGYIFNSDRFPDYLPIAVYSDIAFDVAEIKQPSGPFSSSFLIGLQKQF